VFEGLGLADRGNERRCSYHAHTRNRNQQSGIVTFLGIGDKLGLECNNPPIEFLPLSLQVGDQHSHSRIQLLPFWLPHQIDEILLEPALSLGDNNAAFQKHSAQLIDQSCPFTHQAFPGPVQRLHVELRLGLNLDEPHGRPGCSFRDAFGVSIVILLRFYVRTDILRRHQSYVVPSSGEQPPKMMGATTGLHPDNARRQFAHTIYQQVSPGSSAHHNGAVLVEANKAADILAEVDSKNCNSHNPFLQLILQQL
jgi:hypothetical protein